MRDTSLVTWAPDPLRNAQTNVQNNPKKIHFLEHRMNRLVKPKTNNKTDMIMFINSLNHQNGANHTSFEEDSGSNNISTNASSHNTQLNIKRPQITMKKFMPISDQSYMKQVLPSVNRQYQQAAKFNARLTMYSNSNNKQNVNKLIEGSYFGKGQKNQLPIPN
mmetsp:Transcript_38393/g.36763  ORF Transcript_38393/g.36763 Transcript_38393/m.36763 type:complete len:163 (+) Transcript_38393:656-1144(+)